MYYLSVIIRLKYGKEYRELMEQRGVVSCMSRADAPDDNGGDYCLSSTVAEVRKWRKRAKSGLPM